MVIIYGIPNCDTVKKATQWLNQNKIVFTFHDFKKEGINEKLLQEWLKIVPLECMLNKKSVAWRNLPLSDQNKANEKIEAIKLMHENTNLIKRPVLVYKTHVLNGFNENSYAEIFEKG